MTWDTITKQATKVALLLLPYVPHGARRGLSESDDLLEDSHLAQQPPDVFTQVGTDRRQDEGLQFDEAEYKVMMHALHLHFTVLVSCCLQTQHSHPASAPKSCVRFFRILL